MLTITGPIKLNCREQMKTMSDNLHHKIMSNYRLMPVELRQEELLHMVTSPPEVYLAADENMTVINTNTVFDNKEIKIDVMNNLLNRLSVRNQFELTYQDKVYIETVLRKLGIKNTISFMEEIKKKMEMNQSLEEKIKKYWNYILSYQENQENEYEQIMINQEKIYHESRESRVNLHEIIMNRLNTGLIYQIIDNFNSRNNYDNTMISNHQLRLTEQKKTAHQILLNQMEAYLMKEEIPFIYLEKNVYETLEQNEESYEEKEINQRITQAVLHQLINTVHLERLTNFKNEKDFWINVSNSFHQTAENTLFRMQNATTFHWETEKNIEQILEKKRNIMQNYYENQDNNLRTETLIYPEKTIFEENQYLSETRVEETELLKQQLEKINEKNVENLERLQKVLEKKEIKKIKARSKEEKRQESLRALQEPEKLLLEYRREAVKEELQDKQIQKEVLDTLPDDTRRIMEMIEKYQSLPEEKRAEGISKNNLGLLISDTNLIHLENHRETEHLEENEFKREQETKQKIEHWQKEMKETSSETVLKEIRTEAAMIYKQEQELAEDKELLEISEQNRKNILEKKDEESVLHQERIIEKILKNEQKKVVHEKIRPAVTMVHKQEKQFLAEEELQEILDQSRKVIQEKKAEQVVINERNTVTKVHHQEQTEVTEKHMQDITRMIDQGVKRQIGTISDQVYHRLERKLSNEKKRRGF